jgi:hypothetical protein
MISFLLRSGDARLQYPGIPHHVTILYVLTFAVPPASPPSDCAELAVSHINRKLDARRHLLASHLRVTHITYHWGGGRSLMSICLFPFFKIKTIRDSQLNSLHVMKGWHSCP